MKLYQALIDRGAVPLIAAVLLLAGAAAWVLPRFAIEAGTDVLLDQADPALEYYNRTRADWNTTDEYVILCCTRADWFNEDSLALLNRYVEQVRQVPYVKTVTTVTTLPLLRVKPPQSSMLGPLPNITSIADPAFFKEKDPKNPKQLVDVSPERRAQLIQNARAEIMAHTQARGNLVSEDGRGVNILAYLDVPQDLVDTEPRRNRLLAEKRTPEVQAQLDELEPRYRAGIEENNRRRRELVAGCRALAREWSPRLDAPVRLAGIPIININLVEHIRSDINTFGVVSFAFFVLTFVAIYRRPRFVILPVLACVMPVVIVLGFMIVTGKRMTVITSNLPLLVFVMTLPYSIYLIERYRERRALFPAEDAATASAGAGRDIWIPCLYSATTSMAGFASLVTSGIVPVRTFGLMGAVGMALALVVIFLFLAASFRLLPTITVASAGTQSGVIAPLRPLVSAVLRAPLAVLLAGLALLGLSIWGTTRITAETKFIDYFWPKSEIYVGLDYIDKQMGGTTPLEIMLEGPPGTFKSADGLKALDDVAAFFQTVPETGNVRSLKTLVDEVRKFHPSFNDAKAMAALTQFARAEVREFANDDFSKSRVLVRMKETAPTLNRKSILDRLAAHLDRPELAHLKERRATGVFVLYSNMLQSLIKSQKDTFFIVVLSIWVMLVILFRNPLLALIVLFPQVLPVFVVLGVMGFAGIALDMVTTMIASVAMGVGIDAAIQYTVRYRQELDATGDIGEAVRRSHATIGRAILIAVGIMFAGFLVLSFSRFVPTVYFGLFTGLAMLMGLLASLTILPSVFALFRYPRPRPPRTPQP